MSSRIFHIVAYASRDGAFGGPLAVALNQIAALTDRGHQAILVTGWDGSLEIPGVNWLRRRAVRLGRKPALTVAPTLLTVLWRVRPHDVIHVHLGRDLVSLPFAYIAILRKCRVTVQTHGMIQPTSGIGTRLMDILMTRKVLREANSVLALTDKESSDIEIVSKGQAKIVRVQNAVHVQASPHAAPPSNRVVFIARLHPRKRVLAFAEACRILSEKGVTYSAEVYGPDEGDLAQLMSFIDEFTLGEDLRYSGSLAPGASYEVLRSAAVYVLPSFGEVFPMAVLEAMAAGTAVVMTTDSGISPLLERENAATITDGSPAAIAAAIENYLRDTRDRLAAVQNAKEVLSRHFSIEKLAIKLEEVYSGNIE